MKSKKQKQVNKLLLKIKKTRCKEYKNELIKELNYIKDMTNKEYIEYKNYVSHFVGGEILAGEIIE